MTTSTDERIYWVLLTMVKQIGPARFNRLLERFGSAEAAWNASMLDLAGAGLERRAVESLGTLRGTLDPAAEWQRLQAAGVSVTILDDPEYPSALREIADPPPVLYVRGELSPADDWAIAVVGTRRATIYGRQVTERIVARRRAGGRDHRVRPGAGHRHLRPSRGAGGRRTDHRGARERPRPHLPRREPGAGRPDRPERRAA